jgi:hypothetical protein
MEHIQKDEAAVIGEMLERFPCKREVGVGQLGYSADRVDAVNVGNDTIQRQIG